MNESEDLLEIRKWLQRKDVDTLLTKAARSIVSEAAFRNLQPIEYEGRLNNKEDFLEDTRQELICFILERKTLIKRILASGGRGIPFLLKSAFINHLIDRSRKCERDPERSLYKRIADILRKSPEFRSRAQRGRGSSFTMIDGSVSIPPLTDEEIERIDLPRELRGVPNNEQVRQKKTVLVLASHFWKEVSGLWEGSPVWVDIRDLVRWIGRWVPMQAVTRADNFPDGTNPVDFVHAPGPPPDSSVFDPSRIQKWAALFAETLGDSEKAVLYYRHGRSLSFKQIAARLGYSRASGPMHPLRNAEHKLRYFVRDLPWLSPDDLNREAFSIFFDAILSVLKNHVPEP